MEQAFGQKKKREEKKDLDIQLADELASGLRSSSSSHEHFLRAVGESRLISKKEHEGKLKKEDNEFVKSTLKEHERKIKIELKAIGAKKKPAPSAESIFGRLFGKKKKKEESGEGEEPEKEELGEEKEDEKEEDGKEEKEK